MDKDDRQNKNWVSAHEFRDIVRSLFNGLNLSDSEILDRIEENREGVYTLLLVKIALGNPDDVLSQVRELADIKAKVGLGDVPMHWQRDHALTQFAIDVKRCLIGSHIDATLTNDEAISEIKRLQKLDIESRTQSFETASADHSRNQYKDLEIFRDTVCGYLNQDIRNDWTDLNRVSSEIIALKRIADCAEANKNEPVDNSYIVVENLQLQLRIANKVIARLVGE